MLDRATAHGVGAALMLLGVVSTSEPVWPQVVPLGGEFQVNSYTPGTQEFDDNNVRQQVCVEGDGGFVVVWESDDGQDGDGEGVFGQRFDSSGAEVGTEFQVNTYTPGEQEDVAVCCTDAGDFIVAWESSDQDEADDGVFGQRYDSSGAAVGTEFQVNTYTVDNQQDVILCCNDAGDFVAAWESYEQDDDGRGLFAKRFGSDGMALGTEFQVNTYTPDNQEDAAICCDAGGDFVLSWESYAQDGSGEGVFSQRYRSDGTALGSEFQVNSYTTGDQDDVGACCDGAGNFVVVWEKNPETSNEDDILGQRFSSTGAPRGTEFLVNAFTNGDQEDASICCDPLGDFIVVWEGPGDGSSDGVFGQAFISTGAPTGQQFQANRTTTGFQGDPAIACAPAGMFVVAWDSAGQDGSELGVFARRFVLNAFVTSPVPVFTAFGLGALVVGLLGFGLRAVRRRGRVS